MSISDPDPALVEGLASLDPGAVREFIKRYDSLICASVGQGAYYIDDPRDEQELQNDIRTIVIEKIGTWDRARGRFSTWVYGIARNIVNNYLRTRQEGLESGRYGDEISPDQLPRAEKGKEADPEDGEDGGEFDPEDPDAWDPGKRPSELSDLLKAYYEVVDTLKPKQVVILEHILAGDPHRDLAARLGISEDAAKVSVSRFKKYLGERISNRDNVQLS